VGIRERLQTAMFDTGSSPVIDMANYRQAEAAPYSADRVITAAAQRVELRTAGAILEMANRPYDQWQNEAWEYYDAIGEINYGFGQLASVMSRLRLYGGVVVNPDAAPTSTVQLKHHTADQSAKDEKDDQTAGIPEIPDEVLDYIDLLIASLGSGPGGIAGMWQMFSLNRSVAGEMYLVEVEDRYSIRSTSEVSVRRSDGRLVLKETRVGQATTGEPERVLPEGTYIARIWKQHPRWSGEPTSSMIALNEPCDELLALQRMIRTLARSRMNAGMMFIPDALSVAGASVTEDKETTEDETTQFVNELFDAMTTPITDEAAGSSVVPMVVTGEEHLGEKIKYFLFNRPTDQWLIERADKALERVLNGIDIPKEMVAGLDQVRYSNAGVIDENLYKIHIEPSAIMFVDALTSVYLRPGVAAKFPDLDPEILARIVTWYDPTDVVIRVDPAEAATTGYDHWLISADAWRRANGFSDVHAPSQEEIGRRLVIENMTKNLPPDAAVQILQQVLPTLFGLGGESMLKADDSPPEKRRGPNDAISTEAEPATVDATDAQMTPEE
jgi:hypothetical protein